MVSVLLGLRTLGDSFPASRIPGEQELFVFVSVGGILKILGDCVLA